MWKNNLLYAKKTNPRASNNESTQLLLTNIELWDVEYFSPF